MKKRYCVTCDRLFTPRNEMSIRCATCKTVENMLTTSPAWTNEKFVGFVNELYHQRLEIDKKVTA